MIFASLCKNFGTPFLFQCWLPLPMNPFRLFPAGGRNNCSEKALYVKAKRNVLNIFTVISLYFEVSDNADRYAKGYADASFEKSGCYGYTRHFYYSIILRSEWKYESVFFHPCSAVQMYRSDPHMERQPVPNNRTRLSLFYFSFFEI